MAGFTILICQYQKLYFNFAVMHIHLHIHNDKSVDEKLDLIIQKQNTMANELDALAVEVTETKGIMLSAKVLIEGFAAKLAQAGTDPVKLTALKDELNSGSEELAAAMVANPLPGEVTVPIEEPPVG